MAAATISAEALGTLARTLRTKWTRQRCQDAPMKTAPDGGLQPDVVVGDDELDPDEAPGPQPLEERRPEGPVFGVAHVDAQHLSVPVGRAPRWPPPRPWRSPGRVTRTFT